MANIKIKSLRNKILITFLGALLIAILVTISISTLEVVSFSKNTSDDSAQIILKEELDNLNRLTEEKSILIEEFFTQIISEFTFVENYANDLFNGRLNVTELQSYYGFPQLDPGSPPPNFKSDSRFNRTASYDASAWYKPGLSNLSEIDDQTMDLVNISSNLDYVFKTLMDANSAYANIYMGFNSTGLFRIFPYKNVTHYLISNYTSAITGEEKIGYDPRHRPWYTEALDKNSVSFVSPFIDVSFLGLLTTAVVPIRYDNGTLIGVIGADIPLSIIQNSILSTKVLDTGYAYLIDKHGEPIIHQNIDENSESQSILEYEFPQHQADEISSFNVTILSKMKSGEYGDTSFFRNNQKWYISYAPIPSIEFSVALVVPESEITAFSSEIRHEINQALKERLFIFLFLVIFIVGALFYYTSQTSKQITNPLNELTEFTNSIASGNLSKDLLYKEERNKEINSLYSTFQGLVTVLRFGNDEYYAGNIDRAKNNYLTALEFFKSLGNKKGIGICENNLGNIYRYQGDLKKANESYRLAIDISQELHNISPEIEKPEHLLTLSSRLNNLALLYFAMDALDRAEEILLQALEYDKIVDNHSGFVTRYGNLGQVYLAQNRLTEASESFSKSETIGKTLSGERIQAFVLMNCGLNEKAMNNYENAIQHFQSAVELAQVNFKHIAITSLRNLQEIYVEAANLDLIKSTEEALKLLRSQIEESGDIHTILAEVEVEGISWN